MTVPVDLSVVIPAYEEEHRLAGTLDALTTHLRDSGGSWEIVVADDGSRDGTRALVGTYPDPRVRLVSDGRHRGKGHALRLGVAATTGRRILLTDADLAAPMGELEKLEKALADGHAAAAIGSRAVPGAELGRRQHRSRELLGAAGNLLIRATTVPGIRDTQCGFKLFDGDKARAAFAAARVDGWAIDVEVLRHFHREGWPVTEVPVRWSHQPGSKIRPLDYPRFLRDLARLHLVRADALFLLLSLALYSGRFFAPDDRYLTDSLQDQYQWEWFFAVTADNVAHLRNPLFTDLQGYPEGVNLMANTVMPGLSIPLTPLTLLVGPAITLSLVMTLGLAATASAWYRLIARRLTPHHPAAACTGALLAAFAPPMVSHAAAHPNFTLLFMIPPIIERALRLCEGAPRPTRTAVTLGLMAAYQLLLGEEALLLAALGMLLFAAAYTAVHPQAARTAWRPALRGLATAAAVCLPLVLHPLLWQFSGPQSYTHLPHDPATANSPLALLSFAERSLLAGDADRANALSVNPTEQNAFYGWPLALLAVAVTVRLWHRRPVVRALSATAALAALLSLGPIIPVPLTATAVPGPWALLDTLPLLESVLVGRLAMICAPVLGMLLALALADLPDVRRRRLGLLAAVTLALLPLVPAPLRSEQRPEVPAFFTSGAWRSYVRDGETLVPVPLPDPTDARALHWQSASGFGFRLPGGYFNRPYGDGDRTGVYGVPLRYTASVLADARDLGIVPFVDEAGRARARDDLAYWNAGAVVLVPGPDAERLRATVEKLLGRPGSRVGGVWVWDLHDYASLPWNPDPATH
ncbi:glycosyltransferase [Streptomyces sp. NPDC018693]|uniref:glycosyltransferase n=1 Tax=unclassified Streptomyces TaxID=2593676 RepID=UPI00378F7A3E